MEAVVISPSKTPMVEDYFDHPEWPISIGITELTAWYGHSPSPRECLRMGLTTRTQRSSRDRHLEARMEGQLSTEIRLSNGDPVDSINRLHRFGSELREFNEVFAAEEPEDYINYFEQFFGD